MPCTRKLRVADLRRLLLEDADELGADDLALALGLGDAARACRGSASSASTATSGTLKWSRNAATTCSPSFLRISPWSTNTQVSWSPTARCTSSAATDESTPPRQPADDLAVADLVADARDLLLDDRRRRPRHVAAADVAQEVREDVAARRACGRPRGGTGCRRCRARSDSKAATGDSRRRGERGEARRRREDGVAVRHPAGLLGRQPGQEPAVLVDRQLRAAELADLGALDPAAELEREQLHAVTDAQHRDPELEQLAGRASARRRRRPTRARRRGSGPSACAARPPPRRRGAAAARRRPRTRARGARSAASTARRSRGRRPRRPRAGRRSARSRRRAPSPRRRRVTTPCSSPRWRSVTPASSAGGLVRGRAVAVRLAGARGRRRAAASPCRRPARSAAACPRSAATGRSSARRG